MKKLFTLLALAGIGTSANAGTFSITQLHWLGTGPSLSGSATASLDPTNNQALYSTSDHAARALDGPQGEQILQSDIYGWVEWRFRWEGEIGETPPGGPDGSISGTVAGYGYHYSEAFSEDMTPGSTESALSTLLDTPWSSLFVTANGTQTNTDGSQTAGHLGYQTGYGVIGSAGYIGGKQIRYGYIRWVIDLSQEARAKAVGPPPPTTGGAASGIAESNMKVRLIKIAGQSVWADLP